MLKTIIFILLVFIVLPASGITGELKASPHTDSGDCTVCHVASTDTLRGWFVFASTKKEMKTDLNQLCLRCHKIEPSQAGDFLAVGIGHATGKKTAVNHKELPLASDGTITCATTCHNMHVAADDRQLQLKHLRYPVTVLCMSCHDR